MFTTANTRYDAPALSNEDRDEAFARMCVANPTFVLKAIWVLSDAEQMQLIRTLVKRPGAIERLMFCDEATRDVKQLLNELLDSVGGHVILS